MPPLFMPTGPAYQKLDERKEISIDKTEDCLKALEERDWEGLADSLSNDFELGLFPKMCIRDRIRVELFLLFLVKLPPTEGSGAVRRRKGCSK